MTTHKQKTEQSQKIREAYARGLTTKQVIEVVRLPKSTFYERLEEIREQDYEDFVNHDKYFRASILYSTLERMADIEDIALSMARNEEVAAKDRLLALDRIRQARLDMVGLIIEGPTVFRLLTPAEEESIIWAKSTDEESESEDNNSEDSNPESGYDDGIF
jgi:hypothetical protein